MSDSDGENEGSGKQALPISLMFLILAPFQPYFRVSQVRDPKEGKSPFLLYHYPEGEGPDVELIEMVERDAIKRNPNFIFEDIAELEGAKITLKKDVLLPLLMPDFLRGLRRPWKCVLLYGPLELERLY